MFPFSSLRTARVPLPLRSKLSPRTPQARILYPCSYNTITVQHLDTRTTPKCRTYDIFLVHRDRHPTAILNSPFRALHHREIEQTITSATPYHTTPTQHAVPPDAQAWEIAYDAELQQLEAQAAILWLSPDQLSPECKLVDTAMTFGHKLNSNGTIRERNVRCSVRGDLMRPYTHYNQDKVTAFSAEGNDPLHSRDLCAVRPSTGSLRHKIDLHIRTI